MRRTRFSRLVKPCRTAWAEALWREAKDTSLRAHLYCTEVNPSAKKPPFERLAQKQKDLWFKG